MGVEQRGNSEVLLYENQVWMSATVYYCLSEYSFHSNFIHFLANFNGNISFIFLSTLGNLLLGFVLQQTQWLIKAGWKVKGRRCFLETQIFLLPAAEITHVGPAGCSNFFKLFRYTLNRKVFEPLRARRTLAEEE